MRLTRWEMAAGLIGLSLSASGCGSVETRPRTLAVEPLYSACPENCQSAVTQSEVISSDEGPVPDPTLLAVPSSPAQAEPQTPGDRLLPSPRLEPEPTPGMIWFDGTSDASGLPGATTSVPTGGTILFPEDTASQSSTNMEAIRAVQKWPLPADQQVAKPLPSTPAQPDRSTALPATVWHASKTATDDVAVPAQVTISSRSKQRTPQCLSALRGRVFLAGGPVSGRPYCGSRSTSWIDCAR